jgi:hypothetical protein
MQHADSLAAALGRVAQPCATAADGPCAGTSRSAARDRACRPRRPAVPSQGTPCSAASALKSLWRRRKSMLSEPIPRISLREQVQLLERAVRRGQRADAPAPCCVLTTRERRGGRTPARRPSRPHARPALLDHRPRQPVGRVQALVGEAVAVREPALVDGLVLERQHAHHTLVLDLHDQVEPSAVVRADRALARDSSQVRAL